MTDSDNQTGRVRQVENMNLQCLIRSRHIVRDWLGAGRKDEANLDREIDILLDDLVTEMFDRKGA